MFPTSNYGSVVALAAAGLAAAAPAQAQGAVEQSFQFAIPAQSLDSALSSFSRQTGLQIAASEVLLRGKRSQAVNGRLSPRAALARLMSGSGIEGHIVGETVVFREAAKSAARGGTARRASTPPVRQTAPAEPEEPAEIVVSGYRQQNRRSIDAKRQSDVISEFVTQDESGQNPDFNIADALRRVPGVSAVFDEDEGRYVAVRGLNPDYTLVTFNGLQLASSDQNSRRALIEQVPASAVSRMQVIKSPTAKYDGNAIGGLVDLQTRSAFDVPESYFVAQALLGYYDSRAVPGKDKVSLRADATLTTRFGSDDQFGLMLTGSYLERTRDQERILHGGYNYYTADGQRVSDPTTGDVFGVPSNTTYSSYTLTSKRYGGAITLEFKPDDRLHASVYYGHYAQDDDETRYRFIVNPSGAVTPATDTTGTVAAGSHAYSTTRFIISKPIDVAQARFSYDFGRSRLDARASYSQSKWNERGPDITFTAPASASLGYRYDIAAPGFTFLDPAYVTNPANFLLASISSSDFNVRDQVKDAQVDYEVDLGDDGWQLGLGGKIKKTERRLDRETPTWTASGLLLTDFLQGTASYTPPYASTPILLADGRRFWDYFNDHRSAFTPVTSATAGLASDYNFEEQVAAGYVMMEHRGPRHLVVVGGRYEATDVDVARYVVQSGVATPTRDGNDYDHFLPSVVGRYDLTDRIKLRAGYYRALGRPNQADLAGGETRNDSGDGVITVSRPNPALKPRQADSFDLSFEYYFPGDGGLFSAGVFYKDVKDEIFRGTRDAVIDGVAYRITEPQNLQSAKLKGFEINFIQNRLGFLPGPLGDLGVSANFTYIDTDASIVMADGSTREVSQVVDQPARMFNASLFYKRAGFEGRLSYSRPGKSYQSISTASPVEDVVYKPFNQLDLQLRYAITDRVQLIAEGRNLLGESRDTYRPYFDEIREINQHGRGFWAGVSTKF